MKLYYSIVEHRIDSDGFDEILSDAKEKNANEVVILAELEWEIQNLNNVAQLFKNNNIKLTVVLGSKYSNYYDKFDCNIIHWQTYWINWTYEQLKHTKEFRNLTLNPDNFKYPFISLNNRSHMHRCVFMDEMEKEKLIDKGIVTWVKHLNENSSYPYNYFDNRQILLDDGFDVKLDSFLIPKEYNQSLFHVITEATAKVNFITEKTIIPMLMKKPFFVLSNHGYHKNLKELGFELYDEIIDYSFDDWKGMHDRTKYFVQNIHKLLDLNLKETYIKLLPKIEHNYNRALEICKDKSLIPDIIKDRVSNLTVPKLLVDIRYIGFLND